MTAYDFEKAAALENKARQLIRMHRQQVLSPNSEHHTRAIIRIKRLMMPLWDGQSADRRRTQKEQSLNGLGY